MEYFSVQINEHTFEGAEIISSIEGGYLVSYRGILYKVYGKDPGSTIIPSDLKAEGETRLYSSNRPPNINNEIIKSFLAGMIVGYVVLLAILVV